MQNNIIIENKDLPDKQTDIETDRYFPDLCSTKCNIKK